MLNGDEAIALFPPIILDRISADLILSCDKEVGNDLLAHYSKDGKWANFAVDLRSPPKAWGVDGKWACCKIGWIAGNLALKGSIFG